ncbi:MAG: hypothetical protein LBN04_02900 [Oscillospiraceae bacterium]|jgi:hypothetical protein|nr:hypothetical protein [Oscillospiraceae bacterium]
MGNREASAFLAGGLLIAVALLRMLAPALPFDWMTLLLLLGAALAIASVGFAARGKAPQPQPIGQPYIPEGMDALCLAMAETDWPLPTGGLFDALGALHQDKPFAALCAARGMLAMLLTHAELPVEDAATVGQLLIALDGAAAAGEKAADAATVSALFSYAIRALGRLEIAR